MAENSKFINLHVHSHYSLLESTVKIPKLIESAKAFNMDSVALTDLGNMHGAVEFYFAAKEAGIKPILGAEIFYVTGNRTDKTKPARKIGADEDLNQRLFHLVLLAQNENGYHNLCELITKSYFEGFHNSKPRADYELLKKYSENLIVLTGGLKGEIPFHLATLRPDFAENSLNQLKEIYKDRLYLELQENGIPEQATVNRGLVDLSQKHSIPLVAGAETFYLKPEHATAHEVLMCIGAGRTLDENRGVSLVPQEFWFKDSQTVEKQFSDFSEAISNTRKIADLCNFSFKLKDTSGKQIYHLPDFKPKGEEEKNTRDIPKMIREFAESGLKERFTEPQFVEIIKDPSWKEKKKQYDARLKEELDMIVNTGFSGYFLVVSDFIKYAKEHGIPVGPGRGSGAGSLVAYSLKITDVDPIPFNLLFERFINPERISMPDFDVDFCQDRRQEVINYVVEKYGKDKVSQIATFGKLLAKGVIRDVSRVMGYSFSEIDPIAKLIPEELGITLESALEKEPRLQELIENDARLARLFEIAKNLEGLNRHASVHAAGVVITNKPLVEYCPLFAGKEGEAVIQFDKDWAEKIGLIKFDFLGLKTLTVIDNAVKFIHESQHAQGVKEKDLIRIDHIPYKDPNVFKLISSGDNDGIFQLESSGMKDLCQKVQPSNLEDITAINAIYRPGPLNSGMVDDYINRKHGRTETTYEFPQLKEILEETYGVIVYQEQVMRVARVLAGYTLGEADILRRAMGKKKAEEMAKQRDKFLEGCKKNSIKEDAANRVFDLLAKFAEYGFNKSHSAAYGVLSYQTAYLKNYYPAQFMAAMLATEMNDTDKMAQYISDAKAHKIEILPPDVNASQKTFSVVGMGIRFGLEAIKGVGGVAVEVILAERQAKGEFKSFVDFCTRVPQRKVNKKVIEALICSGAFDSIAEANRATLFESVEAIMDQASSTQEQAELGQTSFFDQYKSNSFKLDNSADHLLKQMPEWNDSKKLQMEKNLVGFYVSGHPMEKWWPLAKDFVNASIGEIIEQYPMKKEQAKDQPKKPAQYGPKGFRREEGPKWDIVTAALVSSMREIITKKGTRMAFVELEDARNKIEAICFPESFEKFGAILKQSQEECMPFLVVGTVPFEEENAKIFIRSIETVEEFKKRKINSVVFKVDLPSVNAEKLAQLKAALVKHRGNTATYLEYTGDVSGTGFQSRYALPQELHVKPTVEMAKDVNLVFGKDVVRFQH